MYLVIYFVSFSFYIILIKSVSIRGKSVYIKDSDEYFKENFLDILGIQNSSELTVNNDVWSSKYLESLYNTLTSLPSNIFKSDVTIYGYQSINSSVISENVIQQDFNINIATQKSLAFPLDEQVEVILETDSKMVGSTISISLCWSNICVANVSIETITEASFCVMDITSLFTNLIEKIRDNKLFQTDNEETVSLNFQVDHQQDVDILLQSKSIIVFHSVAKFKYQKLLKYSILHSRQKRTVNSDSDRRDIPLKVELEANPCSRKSWEVDFEELGWSDWIVQPKTFEAYVCSGTCKTDDLKNNVTMSRHAFVRQIYIERSASPSITNSIPEAKCVPVETEALHTLFVDKGNLVLKRIDEIIAKTCGCL